MYLTKTDFKLYLECPKCFWLSKNKPEMYAKYNRLSSYEQYMIREGYEVETHAKEALDNNVESQKTFTAEDNLKARTDYMLRLEDGSYNLYEVKSKTTINTKKVIDEVLKDIAFQTIVLKKGGVSINKTYLVYLNKEYVKEGELNAFDLFKIEEMSDKVAEIYAETEKEIEDALLYMQKKKIDESKCPCLHKTKSNHCKAFEGFNKDIPEHSIYNLNRISKKRINKFCQQGLCALTDIPIDSPELEVSEEQTKNKHKLYIESLVEKAPIIDCKNIKKSLKKLKYPIYFFDYETINLAIPRIDGTRPHQKIPFQYSLHILDENGKLEHREYLAEGLSLGQELVETLGKHIGAVGSVVVWSPFEKSLNKALAKQFTEKKNFLVTVNKRLYDLEKEIFSSRDYVDYRFLGRTSIKNILPVLCPQFSYKDLVVQDGTDAMQTFVKFLEEDDENEKRKQREALLAYCKQDTLAMVEIYKVLQDCAQ